MPETAILLRRSALHRGLCAELDAIPDEEWRRRLREIHRDDHGPAAEIIWSAAEPVRRWPTSDLPTLPSWHRGPVGLIGDAAHATSARRARVERLVREAGRNSDRKAVSSPLGRRLRDLVLPFFLERGVRALRRTYADRVEWDRAASGAPGGQRSRVWSSSFLGTV